jgi:hypothetical protein
MAFRKVGVSGLLAGGLLVILWACSSGKSSPSGPTPSSPVPAPTPTATPTPPPSSPPATTSCPKGSLDARCDRTSSRYLADVEGAIDRLVQARPELFDKNDAVGSGGYRVLDSDAYFAGVVQNLQAAGFCAEFASGELRVKRSNDFNEEFAILLSSGHVRRGDGAYRTTCSPATFPVDASDHIDALRVAFYGIECATRPAPRNADGILPMGCVGHVTATPKDVNNQDVPPWIHGDDLTWEPGGGANHIDIEDDPNSIFNKNLYPVAVGPFTLCATLRVDGRQFRGCLTAAVIE